MVSEEDKKLYALALAYVEDDVEIPVKFMQTEEMTSAFAGITDFGGVVFNELNSDMESDVVVKAKDLRSDKYGDEYEATTTLTALTELNVGDTF